MERVIKLNSSIYSMEAINRSIYRMLGVAVASIDKDNDFYIISLKPLDDSERIDLDEYFLSILSDEVLRVDINQRVEPLKNLLVALAFGAYI